MQSLKFSLSGRTMGIVAGILVVMFSCFCLMLAAVGAALNDERSAKPNSGTVAQQAEPTTASTRVPAVVSTTAPTATPKPAPTANQVPTRAAPTVAPEPSVQQQIDQYAEDATPAFGLFSEGLSTIGAVLSAPRLSSASWQSSVALGAALITSGYDRLRTVNPPPHLEGVHYSLVDAWSHCDASAKFMIRGLDEYNSGRTDVANRTMLQGNKEMNTCTQKIEETTEELQRIMP